jgi:hypothetical protein
MYDNLLSKSYLVTIYDRLPKSLHATVTINSLAILPSINRTMKHM